MLKKFEKLSGEDAKHLFYGLYGITCFDPKFTVTLLTVKDSIRKGESDGKKGKEYMLSYIHWITSNATNQCSKCQSKGFPITITGCTFCDGTEGRQ